MFKNNSAALVLSIFLVLLCTLNAVHADKKSETNKNLFVGTWKLDLRPTPDAEPYYQNFELKMVKGKIKGKFYNTEIENVVFNDAWEHPTIAFTTTDGSSTYHTVGRIENGILKGTTHAIGRDFLSIWSGERE